MNWMKDEVSSLRWFYSAVDIEVYRRVAEAATVALNVFAKGD